MSHHTASLSTMLSAHMRLLTKMVRFVRASQKMSPSVPTFLARQCHGEGSKTAISPNIEQSGYPGCFIVTRTEMGFGVSGCV